MHDCISHALVLRLNAIQRHTHTTLALLLIGVSKSPYGNDRCEYICCHSIYNEFLIIFTLELCSINPVNGIFISQYAGTNCLAVPRSLGFYHLASFHSLFSQEPLHSWAPQIPRPIPGIFDRLVAFLGRLGEKTRHNAH